MRKLFSVASWNVEHFKKDDQSNERCKRVIDFLKDQKPDVIALYETVGKEVFWEIVKKMPGYSFMTTEGPQMQEIVVGVRQKFTSFYTQKTEYKSGVESLRPGSLLTLTIEGVHYPILFLHAKSAPDPRSFGLRTDMIDRSIKFSNLLSKISPDNKSNYIILGDLNTMGMDIKYSKNDILAKDEIERIRKKAIRYNLQLLDKTFPTTWSNGTGSRYPDSNLDHVIASKHLKFKEFNKNGVKAPVDVRGWVDETSNAKKDKWIKDYSDHSLLYFEVLK